MQVKVSTIQNIFQGAVKAHRALNSAKSELEAARDLIDGGLALVQHAESFAGKIIDNPGIQRLAGKARKRVRPEVIDAIFEEPTQAKRTGKSR